MKHKDSDSRMVAALAQQTGYWPVFTFFNSMSNMIDLATVGLIGQKGFACGPRSFDLLLIPNPHSWIECIATRPAQTDTGCHREKSQRCPRIPGERG